MVRTFRLMAAVAAGGMVLGGCSTLGNIGNRQAPDEFEVVSERPLVVPPDFTLRPPKPGAPRPQDVDSRGAAVQALFGPQAQPPQRSAGEQALLERAGAARAQTDIRSTVRDDGTEVVDKGTTVRTILDAPAGTTSEGVSIRPN
jgi:hypothetical protein